MSQRPGRTATLVAASLFVTSSWAAAQAVTTGIIEGRVADQSGGVLPGATVTLRSPTRNTAVTQTTGANGEFKFLALQVGTYELKAELAGFSTISISDVTVNPGSNQRFPLQMKVGSFEEAILVTADSPLINTKDAAESTTLNDKYLSTLPLITRNYTEMPTVFPGVSYSRGARTSYNQFNVRGGDQTGNNYLLDGGSLNRGVGRAGILIAPSVIERVEFLPGGFSAEYGGYQSSVINLISKSGANTESPLMRTRGAAGTSSPGEPCSRTGAKIAATFTSTSTCSGTVTFTGATNIYTDAGHGGLLPVGHLEAELLTQLDRHRIAQPGPRQAARLGGLRRNSGGRANRQRQILVFHRLPVQRRESRNGAVCRSAADPQSLLPRALEAHVPEGSE